MEDKITPIRQKLIHARKERDNRKKQMQTIEDACFLDVLNLSKDKEYAKEHNLTNERGRSIKEHEMLGFNEDYQMLKSSYEIMALEVETLLIELERERNAFKVWYVDSLKEYLFREVDGHGQ